ncbi:hypothetical protein ACFY7H_22225 [Streptomyces sp. NPDC012794]|uniref:hypothetical protein n=1 Tax=Streptomyces sp. NPDC012794 TaxID=3364850 RepID=UPI0036771116
MTIAAGLLRPVLLLSVSASWLPDALSIEQFVAQLPVEAEVCECYNRQREFGVWSDADKDGCDTRAEVLIEGAVKAPQVGERVGFRTAPGVPVTTPADTPEASQVSAAGPGRVLRELAGLAVELRAPDVDGSCGWPRASLPSWTSTRSWTTSAGIRRSRSPTAPSPADAL